MIKKINLRRVGGSVSATLPKDMVDHLNLGPGDSMLAIQTEDGILLTPFDPEFEEAMSAYRRGARKYRNALRELSR